MNALIGGTGFVGSTLLKQTYFEAIYQSTNIAEIKGKAFDTIFCAGASAKKWMSNLEPEIDRAKIDELIAHLDSTTSKKFVLFSTVDVFKNPIGVDESTPVDELGLCAYGLHRRLLEKYVEAHFEDHLIVRLPGLVGPGLRKNIIFDFLNANNIDTIDSRGIFQFYPMVNLWYDIQTALNAGLKIVHLTSEPISVAEISLQGFGKHFFQIRGDSPITYDFRTLYAGIFGGIGGYQYGQREIIQAIRNYAQSQVRTLNWGESKRS